ncbi:Disease resistance protein SUMM2 [Citrus sinensis]|uniref:Disease resistance protein SUMM2 n=1 Tax=Citrus sinensis TaxID=2711 RepID=A0ACB8IHR6_CITSI|nr:Disease resistance protein SUMM2 [Citrus sinensis]
MEILSGVASKLGELLADATINQARYLLCFNSIDKELKDKETNLKKEKDGINERVEQERQIHRAIVVEKDVETWLEDVDKEMADVRNLKAKIDEKKSCLNGWCPNWGWRYWLGRKASKKTSKLSDLLQDRSKFSTVARPKPLTLERELSLPSYFSSTFETTESARNQIIDALKKASIKMVGLHGLGGVGKTTLAKFVGNQLRQQKDFDKVGIVTVSQDPDIIKVQGELVKSLGWALNETDEKERADRLRLMFSENKGSKILIILDDVWKQLDLEKKLGIPISDRDNCCKILLTTRKKSICGFFGCYPQIELGTLTAEEGLTLLKMNARINVNDSSLDGVSKQVAGECKGLPLAIEVVGSALREKGFDDWNLALSNLREAKLYAIEGIDKDDQGVYGCLKFSYDNLNSEESKLCFLLCSLFPEDYEIYLEDLVGYAVGVIWYQCAPSIENARSRLHGTINALKAASLLLDTGNDRSVKMHDIVRDVAIWIGSVVLEEKKFFSKVGIGLAERVMKEGLEQYRGISLVGNKKEEELPSGLVCPNLHILRLENPEYGHRLQVPEHFFEGMLALKVVTIIGGVLSLKSLQILTDLQVLQLIRCEIETSYIATGSISPITIKKFRQLEEFYGRIKNWEVEGMSSEESNARLAELNSQADRSVVCLPKDFTFPKLQRYIICKGKGVDDETRSLIIKNDETRSLIIKNDPPEATSLGIFSALYQNLEFLCLRGLIGCHNIVPSIDERGLNELTCLDVRDCKDLECIMEASKSPHGKSLSRLAELSMWYLPELKWIWKAPAQHVISLQTLTKLNVHRCNKLTYIFTLSQARSLEQLKSLNVSGCERLEYIVEAKFDYNEGEISVGDGNTMLALPWLRKLTLYNLPELTKFCSENYYSTWPALEELELHSSPKLTINNTELEANLQYLGENLKTLDVANCSHLRDTIPALLKHGFENKLFACLETLCLENLRELQVLYHIEQIIDEDEDEDHLQPVCFPKLTRIGVYKCPKLKHLFHISVAPSLQKLRTLRIGFNDELEEVFWHKDGADVTDYNEIVMNELWSLTLFGLPNLSNFWPAGYQIPFPSSKYEVVRNCPKFRPSSEGEDDSENCGAETQQTTHEEDANEDASEEKDDSEHK